MLDPRFIINKVVKEEIKAESTPFRRPVPPETSGGYGTSPVTEGDWVLGLMPEYSGWDVYNNEAKKVDTELVKDWTASLNFLLVFAAIFAAVLSAFIIESKKLLEQDPTEVLVDVIILYTNNAANGDFTHYTKSNFQPSFPHVIVNCLLFASLSASLIAALASVVALQWVADYDAAITRGGSSPEDRAKRRQFRYGGVVRWRMGEIIAALPILLYCSVALFLSGLILWMWSINRTVGMVVAAGAGIAFLFYGVSTLLAVAFASAPFRTPLTRWFYSLLLLFLSGVNRLARILRMRTIVSWLHGKHLSYSDAHKREDRAVTTSIDLGKNALIWLANHVSVSVDSYRRLLLLVGEIPKLKGPSPSFEPAEAPWYSIFDLLGREYLNSLQVDNITPSDVHGIGILQRCHSIPKIQQLVAPNSDINYSGAFDEESYWSQYCDTGGLADPFRPNHLFLLLRDMPLPFQYLPEEIEVIIRLAYWRNQKTKPPEMWNQVLTLEQALPSSFLSDCITVFGDFSRAQPWAKLFWGWRDERARETYLSIAGTMLHIAVTRGDLLPHAIMSLIQGHESLVTGDQCGGSANIALARPLIYGWNIQIRPTSESSVHDSIILLLSQNLASCPRAERSQRVREIIAMLWLRPSNPITINWDELIEKFGWRSGLDPAMPFDWLKQADRIPHILEILRPLADVQANDPAIGSFWQRRTLSSKAKDAHFIEALQTFDRLMNLDCMEEDHRMLVDLVCQDLELGQPSNLGGYFIPDRVDILAQLRDPCLRSLASWARGNNFMEPIISSEKYQQQRRASYDRVLLHLLRKYPAGSSATMLEQQALLWPMFPDSDEIYWEAMDKDDTFTHLQHVSRYPARCIHCLDGRGHLTFHFLHAAHSRMFPIKLARYATIGLKGMRLKATFSILTIWHAKEVLDLDGLFPGASKRFLRHLKEETDAIRSSQYLLFALILNTANTLSGDSVYTEALAALLAGIRVALELPHDPEATSILATLSQTILLLCDGMLTKHHLRSADRQVVSNEAMKTSHLLLAELAVRTVFGQYHGRAVSCARASGQGRPALGWLPPYD